MLELPAVTLKPISKTGAQFQLQVTGPVGPDYILQGTTSPNKAAGANWVDLLTNTPAASPFNLTDTNVDLVPMQFYRVKLGP